MTYILWSNALLGINIQLGVGYFLSCSIIENFAVSETLNNLLTGSCKTTHTAVYYKQISCQVWISSWMLDNNYHAVWSNTLSGFNIQLEFGHSLSCCMIEYITMFKYQAGCHIFIIIQYDWISCQVRIYGYSNLARYSIVLHDNEKKLPARYLYQAGYSIMLHDNK